MRENKCTGTACNTCAELDYYLNRNRGDGCNENGEPMGEPASVKQGSDSPTL